MRALDFSKRTMQVALNDEEEYEGGRLIFATEGGFVQPNRPAGTATIHTEGVVHGVTAMGDGVRYGLFFCDTKSGSGATEARASAEAEDITLEYLVEPIRSIPPASNHDYAYFLALACF